MPEQRFQAVLLRAGNSIYGPWIERRGDFLRATADLVRTNGVSLTVQLFTRKSSGKGNGVEVDAATKITITAAGRGTVEWGPNTGTGLFDLVRFKFTIGTGIPNGQAVFRMVPSVWFDATKQT